MSVAKLKSKYEKPVHEGRVWIDRRGLFWRYFPDRKGWFFSDDVDGPWLVHGRHPHRCRQFGPFEEVAPAPVGEENSHE